MIEAVVDIQHFTVWTQVGSIESKTDPCTQGSWTSDRVDEVRGH